MSEMASSATPITEVSARRRLAQRYREIRAYSLALAAPLSVEDQCIQSMPDASPTKWHLAHTSWFFEAVVLQPHGAGYVPFDDRFSLLFNSYYESLGRVDLMELHPDEKPFFISGSKVREILVSGERPDARIIRPEVADILIEVYRENQAS